MAEVKYELEKLFSRLGLSTKTMLRVRFGGVVGKMALVAIFVALALAEVARQTTDPGVLRVCTYGLLADGFVAILAIALHGRSYPLEATLEGGEVVAYQHVQHEFAAKGAREIGASPPVLEGLGRKSIEAASGVSKTPTMGEPS